LLELLELIILRVTCAFANLTFATCALAPQHGAKLNTDLYFGLFL